MLSERLQEKLALRQQQHMQRDLLSIEQSNHTTVTIAGKQYLNFTSNDYLGLKSSVNVKKEVSAALMTFGLGSGSSAHISGYTKAHERLEQAFAEFLGRDDAIYFGSGYLANLGMITTLADKNTYIVLDKLCHASIIDAVRLSQAKYFRYPHGNINLCEQKITSDSSKEKIIITEGVFSMEGEISDVRALVNTAKDKATLLVDDAHGIGVLGPHGGGVCDLFNLSQQDVPVLITPLGKALASYGAIVSGQKDIIKAIRQFARSYMYSTAPPPLIAAATLASLTLMQSEPWRREKLMENVDYFSSKLTGSHDQTPIKTIIIGSNRRVLEIQETLKANNVLVSAIRPPTVPPNSARLRISITADHTHEDIDRLTDLIGEIL